MRGVTPCEWRRREARGTRGDWRRCEARGAGRRGVSGAGGRREATRGESARATRGAVCGVGGAQARGGAHDEAARTTRWRARRGGAHDEAARTTRWQARAARSARGAGRGPRCGGQRPAAAAWWRGVGWRYAACDARDARRPGASISTTNAPGRLATSATTPYVDRYGDAERGGEARHPERHRGDALARAPSADADRQAHRHEGQQQERQQRPHRGGGARGVGRDEEQAQVPGECARGQQQDARPRAPGQHTGAEIGDALAGGGAPPLLRAVAAGAQQNERRGGDDGQAHTREHDRLGGRSCPAATGSGPGAWAAPAALRR